MGEARDMPAPAVGSVLLPSNQNLDTVSDSHGQAAFPRSYSETGLPEEARSFRGTASMSISYDSPRGLLFRESPFVIIAEGLGPFPKLDRPKVHLP